MSSANGIGGTDGLRDDARLRAHVRQHANQALEEGWIRPHYQVIVRTATGDACGEEALARWIDPEFGKLLPAQFIPVLEEAGLLHEMDMRIVDCVLADMERKHEAGLPVMPVSVNLSRQDLEQPDLAAEICSRVDAWKIPHDLLRIEFVESVASSAPALFEAQVKALHEAGFEVWMDDFGSGSSSFNMLRELDIDLIKLDMSFTQGVSDEKTREIVTSVVKLADKLGMGTLAEGVETKEQVAFLESVSCSMMQGFKHSKALPIDDIIDHYHQGTAYPREAPGEAEYWRTVATVDIVNPSVGDDWLDADNTLLSEFPVSVVERRNGKLRRLRLNQAYRVFLERSKLASDGDEVSYIERFREVHDPFMVSAIERSSVSRTWERVSGKAEFGTGFVFFVKPLVSADECEAFLVVATPTSLGSALGVYGDVPVGYAVYRLVYNEDRTRAVDMEYVFANPTFCEWASTTQDDIIGRTFIEIYGEPNAFWLPYCHRAVAFGERLHDTIYSWDINHWISYYITPSPMQDCCIFAYAFADDERRERQEIIVDRDTSDIILSMVATLNGESSYDVAMQGVLESLARIVRPTRLFLFEIEGRGMRCAFEWYAGAVGPREEDLLLPEELYRVCTRSFSARSITEITNLDEFKSADMRLYRRLKGRNVSRLLVVPLCNDGNLVGYLMAEDYTFDEDFDASKLLEAISSFIGARITSSRLLDKLEWAGMHDALTGMPNRFGIDSAIKGFIEANPNAPYALAILDIDNFKTLNDMYGHAVGDEALRVLAATMTGKLPASVVTGRNGGDEFVAFLTGGDEAHAGELLARLVEHDIAFELDGQQYRYTISIGYASYPSQAVTLADAYTKADAALYAVKLAGKSGIQRYAPELEAQYRYQLGFTPRDIADSIPGAIMVHRAGGDGEILFANEEMMELFECDSLPEFMELTGGVFRNIVHPDDAVRMYEEMVGQVSLSDIGAKSFVDYRIITKNGKVRNVAENGHLVEVEGIGKVFYVLMVDLDERARRTAIP